MLSLGARATPLSIESRIISHPFRGATVFYRGDDRLSAADNLIIAGTIDIFIRHTFPRDVSDCRALKKNPSHHGTAPCRSQWERSFRAVEHGLVAVPPYKASQPGDWTIERSYVLAAWEGNAPTALAGYRLHKIRDGCFRPRIYWIETRTIALPRRFVRRCFATLQLRQLQLPACRFHWRKRLGL